jgi:Fic family protein
MPEPEPDNSYRPPKPPAGVVAQQKEKKGANMRAILGAFAWAAEGKLTPDDVEKMLGVSESTALRYLDELEKEGKILKEVSPDRRIYYTKLPEELS